MVLVQPNLTGLRSSDIKKEQLCALYTSMYLFVPPTEWLAAVYVFSCRNC